MTEDKKLIWYACDDITYDAHLNEVLSDILWIKSQDLRFAVVDKDNKPIDMPADMIHQESSIYNFRTHKYEYKIKDYFPKELSDTEEN